MGRSVSTPAFFKRSRMKKILFIMLIILGDKASACRLTTPSYSNFAISTEDERIFSYGIKSVDEKLPGATISNCRETAMKRRFVMITFGPEIVGLSDSVRGINFDKSFTYNNSCTIENNPLIFKQSEEDEKNEFNSKWKFINECVELTVTDKGNAPIAFPLDQEGCTVTRVSSHSAVFNGGFCFFKPGPDSEYNVSVSVKDSCKSRSGYQDSGARLQDLKTGLNFYTSATYKDDLDDLSAFGSSEVRLSVNPVKDLFKISDNFGILRPTFPGDFPANDIHFGNIKFDSQGEHWVNIQTPFIVNNICDRIAKNGIESSVCDYSTPIAGNIYLKNAKGEVIAEWYDGGLAPAQWQGVLNGEGKIISQEFLPTNTTYKIEALFSDPYYDFNNFKKYLNNKINTDHVVFGRIHSSDGISIIPEVGGISESGQMISIGEIAEVSFPTAIDDLSALRKRLNSYFSSTMFPPIYDKVCLAGTSHCEKTGKPFIKLSATFKVNADYTLSDIQVERNSTLLGSYKRKIENQPNYVCK